MRSMDALRRNKSGFTMVELLVALCLSSIVAMAIYKSFGAQQKVYNVQDQSVEMQQNVRIALDLMVKEIRMAGCDPLGSSGATIVSATSNSLNFTLDITGGEADSIDNDFDGTVDEAGERSDGDCNDTNENITYALFTDTDGIPSLGRSGTSMAQNITNLELYYTLDDGTQTLAPTDLTRIRAVQITILARSGFSDKDYRDATSYVTPSGVIWGPFNDGFRRRLTTTTARCRNMDFK
jgi:type IV pilus assembly protein PilW